MLPNKLQEWLNSEEESYTRIHLDATDFTTVDPLIDFSLVLRVGKKVKQQWTMMIKGHRESHVHTGNMNAFWPSDKIRVAILDQHPLLLRYNSTYGYLY